MKQISNDNAANRNSYIGYVHGIGEHTYKEEMLNKLEELGNMHKEGFVHFHDLDASGLTYNCLGFNFVNSFPYHEFEDLDDLSKINHLFHYIQMLFIKVGNEQSGGMSFIDFDNDMATVLENLNIDLNLTNEKMYRSGTRELILWCNEDHTRMGQTSYYVSFNIGLSKTQLAKKVALILLEEFEALGDLVFKPNIIFKVKKGINLELNAPNYDLLQKSLTITSKKMIPTYLLCDSKPNEGVDPYKLGIMGCRSRVVNDLYGCEGSVGRGNIANTTINLPRLALEIDKRYGGKDFEYKLNAFQNLWDEYALDVKCQLISRYQELCQRKKEDFPTNLETQLWCESFNTDNLEDVFKHGTLSLGFIGLSEAMEVLSGRKFYEDMTVYMSALGFVKHMRDYCDFFTKESKLNFSLLATAGELISGRFIDKDKEDYNPKVYIFSKGFYTNSFHINVDSRMPGYKKIQMEGLFHEYCNGGCISYIELGEAPLGNEESLLEYINIAIKAGTHYLGFNFPKDVCNCCKMAGIFDICPKCKSNNISRIRRVSGYLEILDGFTKGKKNEVNYRRSN